MAEKGTKAWGNDNSEGNLEYLDSKAFGAAIEKFSKGVTTYNDIIEGIKTTTSTLLENWKGEGRTQFEKDYNVIFLQLKDIGDILYDLRDALISAQAEYETTDDTYAKSLTYK
ncbi:WXG100 family type VII secretion target [Pseudobutyrivibrio sp. 49]|uniref:WXG100 family type VII secretion target n=1 Tax=unclassified Pseudobutyrivibrio TaxID=2638619 RepID=UPI0008923528|nr:MULTISPECIES: WXG100 family type VII secretion target [unclassified Pseudobutyrivibrio]SDI35940.1 WXG100 family type VII secretion target [Pseudobutyrivibrio sp. 49]SFN94630.1 WXG100 family type VII secretion target [Pseudobutyrivibrio sp. UC1225]